MRLPWSRASKTLVGGTSDIVVSQDPVFTIMYRGGPIDVAVAQLVVTSLGEWLSTLGDSSTASIEIVEMPSRLANLFMRMMSSASIGFIYPPVYTLESLIAMLGEHGCCPARRAGRRGNTAVDVEGRAAYCGWPLYYV
jgi:hypothetical protein